MQWIRVLQRHTLSERRPVEVNDGVYYDRDGQVNVGGRRL